MTSLASRLLAVCLVTLVAGCATGPVIDRTYSSASQDSRAQFLILHFTWGDWDSSLKVLTEGPVSSHYLVRDKPVRIYGLVDENRRAWHAGASWWKGHTHINASSIGIEIVNAGNRLAAQGIEWEEYPPEQIDAVVALVKDIVRRHQIRPDRILGHSDIAPLRKVDPGPKFPWKRLADEGLIVWPDAARVAERRAMHEAQLPDVAWFQAKLGEHGFAIPQTGELDVVTQKVVAAFQMKYRPARFDGIPDAETAALLDVLTAPAEPRR
jgi:N-acetylmuramoyl-L-alanine amidase